MKRALVSDRSSGEAVAEVTRDGAGEPPGRSPDVGRGAIVLVGAQTISSGRGTVPRSGVQRVEVVLDGWRFEFEVEDAERAELRARAARGRDVHAQHGPTDVRAIIPGRVLTVAVSAGDVVTSGQQLLTVEAMKMQNELRSPRDGTVERVAVAPGATVEPGDLLLVLG
jgi:biotin carboxyl carrier protein